MEIYNWDMFGGVLIPNCVIVGYEVVFYEFPIYPTYIYILIRCID